MTKFSLYFSQFLSLFLSTQLSPFSRGKLDSGPNKFVEI